MHSIHNEEKSIIAERFIRTLKNKIYKYITTISKYVYTDKLDDVVDEYNNTYHNTIKMKPIEVNYLLILRKKFIIKIQNLKLVIM